MRAIVLLLAMLAYSTSALANATITIVNGNAPGVGFNDPTPATPVGGNTGTTVGEQRLIAFEYAASIWGSTLDSGVEILILATFESLTCTATAAVLGSAGTRSVSANFDGATLPDTWHSAALANKLSGVDQIPPGTPNLPHEDIRARFNSNLNGNPACLGGRGWYYGLDFQHGTNIDLVTVLLHEFGHGLGFQTFVNLANGAFLAGGSDTYAHRLRDNQTNLNWEEMTQEQRAVSIKNGRRVVWTGPEVTAKVPDFLVPGTPFMEISAPLSIAGTYLAGAATFGAPLTAPGTVGDVVAAVDAVETGGTATDGCSPFTNAAEVGGHVALVDRGLCANTVKYANAVAAGATAVIVADNVAGTPPPGMSGIAGSEIPAARITQADGNLIRERLAALEPVTVRLFVDLSIRAGADPQGRALVNATDPVQPGSSISHWDPVAFRNLLMEPAINDDLTHALDLTTPQMRDIGWYPDADVDRIRDAVDKCADSDLRSTVIIESCDSGTANTFFTSGSYAGCSISDLLDRCVTSSASHGQYQACVSSTTNQFKKSGLMTEGQRQAILECAADSSLP